MRLSFLLCVVVCLVVGLSSASAGEMDPPVHAWGFWSLGVFVFPDATYIVVGTFSHRFSVAAQTVERIATISALVSGAILALVAWDLTRRRHQNNSTGNA